MRLKKFSVLGKKPPHLDEGRIILKFAHMQKKMNGLFQTELFDKTREKNPSSETNVNI